MTEKKKTSGIKSWPEDDRPRLKSVGATQPERSGELVELGRSPERSQRIGRTMCLLGNKGWEVIL